MEQAWVVLICVLALQKLTFSSRIKQLEGRLEVVESRQDVESMLRRQEKSAISEKLDILETRLNETAENPQCCDAVQTKERQRTITDGISSEYSTKDEFMKLLLAFSQEKTVNSRWRRRVPEMENTMNGVGTEVTNILNVVEEIRGEIIDEKNELENNNRSKSTLSEKMDMSIQLLENVQERYGINEQTTETVNMKLDEVKAMIANSTDTSERNERTVEIIDAKLDEVKAIIANSTDTSERNEKTVETVIKRFDERLEAMESRMINLNNNIETMMKLIKTPSSCQDLYRDGERKNGIYYVFTKDRLMSIQVLCDMTTDGGGWTIFQRRKDGSEDFYRTWLEYEQGFGQLDGEFWLGNDKISSLTSKCCHVLRIDLEDFDGNTAYAKYVRFQVRPMSENYKLIIGKYSGTAGNSLAMHANQQFTTKDRNNDESKRNCAVDYNGAWWYNNCHHSNLNGQYQQTARTITLKGVVWFAWKNKAYSLKKTEMKFR